MNISTTTLDYPRIDKSREVKKALESFWRDKITAEFLLRAVEDSHEK